MKKQPNIFIDFSSLILGVNRASCYIKKYVFSYVALVAFAGLTANAEINTPLPVVSRWMDSTDNQKPQHSLPKFSGSMTFESEIKTHNLSGLGAQGERVCIVVHSNLCSEIGAGLTRYELDLQSMGFSTLRLVYSEGSAEDLRNYLAGLYSEPESLAGTVFVGNIPYLIFEIMQDWDGDGPFIPQYDDFPSDIFFMDLDGVWEDSRDDGMVQSDNGKYDTRSGDLNLEIWVGRLKADNFPELGSETDIIRSYFDKNNRFRQKKT